jgi:deoxyribonuclease IV
VGHALTEADDRTSKPVGRAATRRRSPAPRELAPPPDGATAAGWRIGAHVPTAGGLARASLPYIDASGADVVQVYVSNPRGWALSTGDPAQDEAFATGCAERDVIAFIHASLLVNLGSPTPETVRRSAGTLDHALRRGAVIGARAVVFHAGNAVDTEHAPTAYRQLHEKLLPLLDAAMAAGGPRLLVEPSAGGGRSLAARVEALADYFDAVEYHPWLGVCFDTCHAWAAGHDLATPGGMTQTLDALVAACGADRLALVHANDSKDGRGSLRDRHQNIGAGLIGTDPFRELFAHPAFAGVPVVVETPSERAAGHAADIATLRQIATAERPGRRRATARRRPA